MKIFISFKIQIVFLEMWKTLPGATTSMDVMTVIYGISRESIAEPNNSIKKYTKWNPGEKTKGKDREKNTLIPPESS